MRYAALLLITLCLCFGAQALGLLMVGGRTVKSESNFFSSVGRIQASAKDSPEIMLLGSSITGRLPDRAHGFAGVANLGCDGGSAVDTLRAIHKGRLPRAPIIFVEANALHIALRGEGEVAAAMRRPWFHVGMRVPLLSSYARPSAFAYSILLASRTGNYGTVHGEGFPQGGQPGTNDLAWDEMEVTDPERELADEMSRIISDLRKAGSRIIVVWLPPGREDGQLPSNWIRKMVSESGAEWWDLGHRIDPSEYRLTDGVHMDAESATKTIRTLLSAGKSPTS